MKARILLLSWALLGIIPCLADNMDPSAIKLLMQHMDDALVQGQIYHINYFVCDKCTDAFYAHKKEMIKFVEDGLIKEQNTMSLERQDRFREVAKGWKKELERLREQTFFSDFSLDGKGFYLKRSMSWVDVAGNAKSQAPGIYVSDGKVMGTFYLDNSQAVVQPATERPLAPGESWNDLAYLFMRCTASTYMGRFPVLSMHEENGKLIITGNKPGEQKELAHAELTIDKATFTPDSLVFIYHNESGLLYQKLVKTWQFQRVSGVLIPKTVIDQEYDASLSGKLELERERTLTINQFDPTPLDSKAEFEKMLKGNFAVYDEITGTHYLSGSPGDVLDKLSK